MCVTSAPADMEATRAYTYAILDPESRPTRHITGYQNTAHNRSAGPNCMILHFPGHDLELVSGPERTHTFMLDMTSSLPSLVDEEVTRGRGATFGFLGGSPTVEHYGDYDVVLAHGAGQMLDVLGQVDEKRRPVITPQLEELVDWYNTQFPGYSFVLACFDGAVKPKHPIVVEYVPDNDDVLFIPGLDAHTGSVPVIGQPMKRDFRVAFGVEGWEQPIVVHYHDHVAGKRWAPRDVTGFHDNRWDGPNEDYIMPLVTVDSGVMGWDLLHERVPAS